MRCTPQTRNHLHYILKSCKMNPFNVICILKIRLFFHVLSHSSINRDSSFVFQRISHNFGFDPSFNVKSKCKFEDSSLVLVLLVVLFL